MKKKFAPSILEDYEYAKCLGLLKASLRKDHIWTLTFKESFRAMFNLRDNAEKEGSGHERSLNRAVKVIDFQNMVSL